MKTNIQISALNSHAFNEELVLNKLCELLRDSPPTLSSAPNASSGIKRDARLDSARNEPEVFNHILAVTRANEWFRGNKIIFEESKSREWFDFSISRKAQDVGEKDIWLPVNTKITEQRSADNLNCKLGLYYALTGKLPSFQNSLGWTQFLNHLKAGLLEPDGSKDYYFLIIEKNNPEGVFYATLKTLEKLTPNGNNLPFQAHWSKNKKRIARAEGAAQEWLLKNLWLSIEKRESLTKAFRDLFPEIVS